MILAGPTVLSAVGACPPHDGVRQRWWINVASAISLIESSQKIGRFTVLREPWQESSEALAAKLALDQKVVNFEQILFANGRRLNLTEGASAEGASAYVSVALTSLTSP
jgi:hypothetical protein